MASNKSLDEVKLIAALLHDIHMSHGVVFNNRALRLTCNKLEQRTRSEGLGFLTKTLPSLGKAFDKALSNATKLSGTKLGFETLPGTELPRFLGEFFSLVLDPSGGLLQNPCANSVRILREILYLFYKYELPYTDEQEQQVLRKFEKTEEDLSNLATAFQELETAVSSSYATRLRKDNINPSQVDVVRKARHLLSDVFAFFDPTNIKPRHGPGVVATKQRLWEKFHWSNVSDRITSVYPLDAYFYTSLGHVCDRYDSFSRVTGSDLSAKVILVPKDSRGPRLISCEPVDFQWIQQGLGRAIVELVEHHKLTCQHVYFTNQHLNRFGALYGSRTGKYATLDLNEASDRVSTGLVRLLFPSHVYTYLEACRSLSTVMPSGKVITLNKYAPMGSCLCFPILALTTWAILTAACPDTDTREGILVYGDDVIVPTAYAANAIEHLESFGLKVNRDKSCTSGLFRESCGMDAFNGIEVTPVRLRTVWSESPSPESYASWISYANSLFDRKRFRAYDYIVGALLAVYGQIPDDSMYLTCPSLRETPVYGRPKVRRFNKNLQKFQYKVNDLKSPVINKSIDGWSMLLRYFSESGSPSFDVTKHRFNSEVSIENPRSLTVSQYTSRRTSMLVKRWR
jgi:hypothetical protein